MPIILKGIIYLSGNMVYFTGIDEKGIEHKIVPLESLIYSKAQTIPGFFTSQEAVSVVIYLEEKK